MAALNFKNTEHLFYGEEFSGYFFYTYYPPAVIKTIKKIKNGNK